MILQHLNVVLSLERDLSFKGKEGALLTLPFLKFFKTGIQDLLGWGEGTEYKHNFLA